MPCAAMMDHSKERSAQKTVRETTAARLTAAEKTSAVVGFGLAGEGTVQPGLGVSPVAVGGGSGDAQHVGRFLDRQPAEVAQLDQFRLPGVLSGQLLQRLIEGE